MTRERKRSPGAVLAAIRHAEKEAGMPPTIAELRDRLQVGSTRTVLRYLQDLEEKGWITRWPGARGIRVNVPEGVSDGTIPSCPHTRTPIPREDRERRET